VISPRKKVIIVGMGFGGIRAARGLVGSDLDVLLLDRTNYHLFQPLLYQVATAGLEQEAIAYPIRAIIRGWEHVTFKRCEVVGLDLEKRRVDTDRGEFGYDYLVLAGGSVTNYFGNSGIAAQAFDLKSLNDADRLRNSILCAFEDAVSEQDPERRRALLTFVVVGGGPTGVEFAGALSELAQYVLSRDYPTIGASEARVILLEAAPSVLSAMPEPLRDYALRKLGAIGVEVRCGTMVADASPGQVRLASGEVIATRTLFWSAGVKASPLADMIPGAKGPGGRVQVGPALTLPGHDEVLVIGDMACCMHKGAALPMMAPVAMQQGRHAARVILAREAGQSAPEFSFTDKGSMATIGRSAAVATAHGINISGFVAWLAWLLLHLYYLIGFRNRIVVLLNWAWYYWFHERQVRLITGTPKDVSDERPSS
jgi:NADH dehydrogenase